MFLCDVCRFVRKLCESILGQNLCEFCAILFAQFPHRKAKIYPAISHNPKLMCDACPPRLPLNSALKQRLIVGSNLCPYPRKLQNFFHRRALVFELVKQMLAKQTIIPRSPAAILWRQFVQPLAPCDGGNLLSDHVRMNQLILRLRFRQPDAGFRADKEIRMIKYSFTGILIVGFSTPT